jgi:hypothetical protein
MNIYALTITRKKDAYTETYLIQADQCPCEAWIIKHPDSKLLKELPKDFSVCYLMPASMAIDKCLKQCVPGDWPHCEWHIEGYDCFITAFCPAKEKIIEPKDYWRETNTCR